MFRPPRHHPYGGPPRNDNLRSQQSPGMTAGPALVPSAFPMHGRGRFGVHPPFHGGPSYLMFPPAGPATGVRPPPPPDSPPVDTPPPPPPSDGKFRSGPKSAPPPSPTVPSDETFRSVPKSAPPPPPPMPKDPEMLKNIEILSSFVVKNGPQFESMARAKQAGDPKFAFLFGGERGSDAAFGYDFYNWKKQHLTWVEERTKTSPVDQQRAPEPILQEKNGGSVMAGVSPDALDSPAGSDMDMEDDLALPHPPFAKYSNLDESPAVPSVAVGRKWGSSHTPTERIERLSPLAPEWRPDFPSSSLETRPPLPLSASDRKSGHESVDPNMVLQVDRDPAGQIGSRLAGAVKGNAHGGQTARATDASPVQRGTALPDVPKRRDTRRRTGFDRPCMEDVSPQGSPVWTQQHGLGIPGNGHQDGVSNPSRWGPESSAEGRSSKLDTSTRKNGDINLWKDRPRWSDVAANPLRSHRDGTGNEKPAPNSASSQPVDEFGRLLRKEGSDSDLDDDRFGERKKRRRTMSRSRSRSPGQIRFKYRSPEKSAHAWSNWSRSSSRSPRRSQSRSLTPPCDGRWGGEGRDNRGRLRKGGRRVGGRGDEGASFPCPDFLKGKCSRGSSCRNTHNDVHGKNGDQGGKSSSGRGRHRDQGQTGRGVDERERNWSGRSGDDSKHWRAWEPNEFSMGEPRGSKLIAESKNEEHGLSVCEATQHPKGTSDDTSKLADEVGRTGPDREVVSSSGMVTKAFTPHATTISPSQSIGPLSQAVQQTPNMPMSQQTSSFSNATSEAYQLGSTMTSVSQHSPILGSPTLHPQQVHFPLAVSQLQQISLPPHLQPQRADQSLSAVSQVNSFASIPVHQQFTTAARNLFLGGSPPLQVFRPPFAAIPVGRPQNSFIASQRANFGQLSGNSGQGGVQFGPQGANQTQMLRSPAAPPLQQLRPGLAWISGGMGSTTSCPLRSPQPLQPLELVIDSLQKSPHTGLQRSQPLHQPISQPLPPQVSNAFSGDCLYPIPTSYVMPAYSTLSTTDGRASQPSSIQDQYDPLSDSLEPEPPGSADKNSVVSNNQGLSQDKAAKSVELERWRYNPIGVTAPLMTNAGEVVLENVSPGLPGHMEALVGVGGMMGKISPTLLRQTVMENVGPTLAGNVVNSKAYLKTGGLQQGVPMENVTPPDENSQEADEDGGKDSGLKRKNDKKKDKEGRVLNLIRKAVAEHVKESLKPTWKGGQITKEAFKIIAKKAVDKVMGALEDKGQIPKTQEKVDALMKTSKPKISKLVQGYIDKYVKL